MPVKASVIIPVYNAGNSLQKCVESIIYGNFHDLRIILVDDCSSDNSWDICCKLSRQHDNVICKQNDINRGVSYTRNQGLSEAKGEYIFFVDSDDWVSARYFSKLYSRAEQNDSSFVICGFKLIDRILGQRKDYGWETGMCSGEEQRILIEDAFKLFENTLLQQLWNKVFRRDIIEKHHIRFAEDQSMGEDFQFVLDYLDAAAASEFLLLNEVLYYYVRDNKNSLMSKYGLSGIEGEKRRLTQLLTITGEKKKKNIEEYEKAIANCKNNAIYQAVHCDSWKRTEKINYIETIMNDGMAERHYHKQWIIKVKEIIRYDLNKVKLLVPRCQSKMQRIRRDSIIKKMYTQLKCRDFSIISQNCIGGVFYHDMKIQFMSPTINLFFTCADFVKFVSNLDYYLQQNLIITWGEEYPIGYLDDIIVYFQHYACCEDAKLKWEERKKRINKGKIIILCTDMEGFSDEVYEKWKEIPYPKILFSAVEREDLDIVYYPEYSKLEKVQDLIPERKFYRNNRLINLVNKL